MELQELDLEKFEGVVVAVELQSLLKALDNHNLSEASINYINEQINQLNSLSPEASRKTGKLKAAKNAILKHLAKEYKLVTKNYYATLWMPLGMTAFGLPLGTAVYVITGNAAFIGIGLPLGMAFGSFYGATLDKKAEKENRVLKLQE